MADDKPQFEYEIVTRDAHGNEGHASLEGVPGGARTPQEAAAEASMVLQNQLKLTPIERDR